MYGWFYYKERLIPGQRQLERPYLDQFWATETNKENLLASETGMKVISAISCYCEVIPRSSQLTVMHILLNITVNEREIQFKLSLEIQKKWKF